MNLKSKIATAVTASLFALSLGTATMAQQAPSSTTDVTQVIEGGSMTVSLTDGSLPELQFDAEQTRTNTGEVILTVNDNRGNYAGWNVSMSATDFEYSGNARFNGNANIPVTNLALGAGYTPTTPGTGNNVQALGFNSRFSNGQGILVMQAQPGFGTGVWNLGLPLNLDVPAGSPVGSYTSTITVSATSAPGT